MNGSFKKFKIQLVLNIRGLFICNFDYSYWQNSQKHLFIVKDFLFICKCNIRGLKWGIVFTMYNERNLYNLHQELVVRVCMAPKRNPRQNLSFWIPSDNFHDRGLSWYCRGQIQNVERNFSFCRINNSTQCVSDSEIQKAQFFCHNAVPIITNPVEQLFEAEFDCNFWHCMHWMAGIYKV